MLFTFGGPANAGLVNNGSFDNNLSDWKTKGQVNHDGKGRATLSKNKVANKNGLIQQRISLDESWTGLSVSFDYLFKKWSPTGKDALRAFLKIRTIDDSVVSFELLNITNNSGDNWKHITQYIDLSGLSPDYSRHKQARIVFKLKDNNKKSNAFAKIDNVKISSVLEKAIPEPTSLLLMSIAFTGLGYARRKKI